jgi:DNA helicase HerA-like ATPase
MSQTLFEYIGGLRIGTVEFVSPDEIKVLLDIESPESVALNAGTPRPFPRVNSYVLIQNDEGFLVGQVEWLTVERSDFPKRRGMQDFGLVGLPYPLRKMSLNPLGTLRKKKAGDEESYTFRRGADAFPSIGDGVFLPTDKQLRSIVESGEKRRVKIGTSPLAGFADVYVDPDRLFGRHLAVLGNTGSGKSCTVAGLIRWSLETAQKEGKVPNARFIVLDPNGEYARAFSNKDDKIIARIFKVNPTSKENPLQVPIWFWNSAEWCSFTHAGERAHKPILQQALRLRRNARKPGCEDTITYDLLCYLEGALATFRQEVLNNSPFVSCRDSKYWGFIELLKSTDSSLHLFLGKKESIAELLEPLINLIDDLLAIKCKNERNYNKPFEYGDIDEFILLLKRIIESMGGKVNTDLPVNEDIPIPFSGQEFIVDLDFLATNGGNRQWFDFFLERIRTLLSDTHMQSIIGDNGEIKLEQWLTDYIGDDKAANGCVTIIDLSLVPMEIIHIINAVIARMVFEAQQRYRKLNDNGLSLPTVLVMEEAHTFIKRYRDDAENQDAATICCQVFERIAREGRKFGLGLLLSSQRPSELSQTVLSQCNTFLLHRISNDRDQELVQKLVPDNLRGLLRELPSLPSQNAILLGWASELPVLVRMNDLPKSQQPQSEDPDFWAVWTGKSDKGEAVERNINWTEVAMDWQGQGKEGKVKSAKPLVAATEERGTNNES